MRKRNEREMRFLSKVDNLYGESVTLIGLKYKTNREKVKVRCNIHNVEYSTWIFNFIRGNRGCPRCAKKLTIEDFIDKSVATHGNKYSYDKVIFKNATTKVTITCPKHGDFETRPVSHYYEGCECPECAKDKERLGLPSFVKRAKEIHGDMYNYDKVRFTSLTESVIITCPKHGDFNQPARSHLAGHSCKQCSLDRTRSNLKRFIQQANEIHGSTYDYTKSVYRNSKTLLTVICKTHGEFVIRPNSHISSKGGCPRCRESYGERCSAAVLDELNIRYVREYKIEGSLFRYDFYLNDHGILLEFHGIQHYMPVNRFGGLNSYFDTVRRDIEKIKLAELKNLKLVVVNYKDLASGKLPKVIKKRLKELNVIP